MSQTIKPGVTIAVDNGLVLLDTSGVRPAFRSRWTHLRPREARELAMSLAQAADEAENSEPA